MTISAPADRMKSSFPLKRVSSNWHSSPLRHKSPHPVGLQPTDLIRGVARDPYVDGPGLQGRCSCDGRVDCGHMSGLWDAVGVTAGPGGLRGSGPKDVR